MSDDEPEEKENDENLETKDTKQSTTEESTTDTPATSFIGKSTAHKIQKPRGVLVRRKMHKRKLRDQMYEKAVRLSNNQLANLPQ